MNTLAWIVSIVWLLMVARMILAEIIAKRAAKAEFAERWPQES